MQQHFYICDKCKKKFSDTMALNDENFGQLVFRSYTSPISSECWDLCKECVTLLKFFIKTPPTNLEDLDA